MTFYASERHYADHLIPIWAETGGAFYVEPRLARWMSERHPEVPLIVGQPKASLVCVAGFKDLRQLRNARIILVEHGAGQTYQGMDSGSYAGGTGRERVRLFLCPNEQVANHNRVRYIGSRSVAVGSPKLEALPREHSDDIAISFHWDCGLVPETRWAFPHFLRSLGELKRRYGSRLIGHGHPRAFNKLQAAYKLYGIEPVEEFSEVCRRASVYVCDNSSTLFEFAALGRPVVLLNAPGYRKDVRHGLRFWDAADIGEQVSAPEVLGDAIGRALDDPGAYASRREAVTMQVYGNLEGAAQRSAEAIRRLDAEPVQAQAVGHV